MKKFQIALAVVFCAISVPSYAWTIHASFGDGEIGERAQRTGDDFHGVAGGSTVSDEQKLKGNSARISIREGETGYGMWGGAFYFPEHAHKGETIWFLVHTYMPEDFDHYSYGAGNRLKFLRIQTFSEAGSNQGYNDLYFDMKGRQNPFKWIYEGDLKWVDVGSPEHLPKKETWESYEMAVTLDNVPVSEGGSARVLIWKNGELLEDITDKITLKDPNGYSNKALLFTYWNGGAPQDQHMYVDEITVTNETPENVDAHGNAYIGGLIGKRPLMTEE